MTPTKLDHTTERKLKFTIILRIKTYLSLIMNILFLILARIGRITKQTKTTILFEHAFKPLIIYFSSRRAEFPGHAHGKIVPVCRPPRVAADTHRL